MKIALLIAAAALTLTGCGKNIENKEAVDAAIQKRLVKTGFTPENMTVNVTRVTFHDNEAQATVQFLPKGAASGGGVTFKYNLRREKDEWVVVGPASGGATGGATGHPGMSGTLPQGEPGATPTAPPIDPSQPLPQGHPPLGSKPDGSRE